jgi:hypothetical protein
MAGRAVPLRASKLGDSEAIGFDAVITLLLS